MECAVMLMCEAKLNRDPHFKNNWQHVTLIYGVLTVSLRLLVAPDTGRTMQLD